MDKLWMRAQAIANFGELRINTEDDAAQFQEVTKSISLYGDAQSCESILQQEEIQLLVDRQQYIMAMDKLMKEITDNKSKNSEFWEELEKILTKESDEFIIDKK